MSARPVRTLLTIVMDVLVIVAVIVVLRVVVEFFGALAAQQWGKSVLGATRVFVIPFGVEHMKTPYGGVFDVDAALTVLALLAAEWVIGIGRRSS